MTDNELKPPGLPGKIAKIMGELQRIPENGTNTYFKYSFVSADDVYDTVRKALAAERIAFFASMIGWKQDAAGKSIKTICDFEFTFVDADTGESRSMLWSGEANDEQDKGLSKAATSAEKYFLLKTFMISTGKDDDADAGPKPATPRQQPQQQQRQNAPQRPQQAPPVQAPTNSGGNAPAASQRVAEPVPGTTPIGPYVTNSKDWAVVKRDTLQDCYQGNEFHQDASIEKGLNEGWLTAAMTVSGAIMAIRVHRREIETLKLVFPRVKTTYTQPTADERFKAFVADAYRLLGAGKITSIENEDEVVAQVQLDLLGELT